MKVMLLIPHVSDGGGEKVLSELSCNLGADEVVLVVFEQKFSYPVTGKLLSLDLPIDRGSFISRARGFLQRSYRFWRALRRERPNVVISFMGEANLINALLSSRPILTVHNHMSSMSKVRGRLEAAAVSVLMRVLYRRATIVAVSEAIKIDLVQSFGISQERVVVIPNAVDTAGIQKMAAEPMEAPWQGSTPVIITAGRLTLEKGQWHLIRAFAEVRKKTPCRLAILGVGELDDYLRRLAREMGIEKDVFFLGWQTNPFKFIARADLFVSSSITEGFGLALIEAMACKVPVIATDCPGGSREIIAPGNAEYGLLVPALDGNPYSGRDPLSSAELHLADAMFRMLQNQNMRANYMTAGLSRIEDFGLEAFVDGYHRLIKHVVDSRGGL